VQMMLTYLGQTEAANAVDRAIAHVLVSKQVPSVDARSGLSTRAIGDLVLKALEAPKA